MKRSRFFLFGILFSLFAFSNLTAQRFEASVVAGVNLSQLDGDKLNGFHLVGANVGGKVSAILGDRWQLSMEMLFTQQGSNRVKNDDPTTVYDRINLNYVEVPVMLNFLEWKFHVSAGVSYGRLINFTVRDVDGEDVTDDQDFNPDIFAAVIGATFFFNDHFGLNVQWSKYLNDLQAAESENKLIGRNIAIRGIYKF